jgi:hypothetical protein
VELRFSPLPLSFSAEFCFSSVANKLYSPSVLHTRLSRMSPEFSGSGDLWNPLGVQWIPKNIRPFGFHWAGLEFE